MWDISDDTLMVDPKLTIVDGLGRPFVAPVHNPKAYKHFAYKESRRSLRDMETI